MLRSAIRALAALLAVGALWAEVPEFKDILNLESPGSILISPDGAKVVYSVRKPDWEENEYRSQLWIIDVESGEKRQLTFGENSPSSARFSPDGRYLSYITSKEEEEKPQVYLLPMQGGEARPATDSKAGVNGYAWAPDSRSIAYSAADEESEEEREREEKLGEFEIVDEDFKIRHLWMVGIDSEEAAKIVGDEDRHIAGFAFSPDGGRIAFSAAPDSRLKSFSKSDLYVVDVESKDIRTLVDQKGPDSSPAWSPDGKHIAFNTNMGTETYFVNTEIAVVPSQGGEIRLLTGDFDEDARLAGDAWTERGIHFSAYQRMSRHLFRLDPASKAIEQLTEGDFVLSQADLSKDGSRMALSYVSGQDYPEVYVTPADEFQPRCLTEFSQQVGDWTLASKEKIAWASRDGTEITGVLVKPADFDTSKKYPLFVVIHGGPTGISYPRKVMRYNRYYPIEQWAAKGALVLLPNYRGSAGFGAEFRKLNYRNLGVGDYWDVITGVEHLIGQGFVDESKLGSMGWSQGGYITAFITTYSARFAATSVGAGISDWVTYYYQTDITPFTRHYLGATPWEDMEVYRKTSPMTHINQAQTPTLIQHGEFDKRVPTPNAYKLYRGLQDNGVPSRLIIYKGFGHGISKPKENLAVLTHNWEWFNRWIWGEEASVEETETSGAK